MAHTLTIVTTHPVLRIRRFTPDTPEVAKVQDYEDSKKRYRNDEIRLRHFVNGNLPTPH